MHPDWARSLRDQCAAAGVPFLFKQWGEWLPAIEGRSVLGKTLILEGAAPFTDNPQWHGFEDGQQVARIGKKAAGRLLDGFQHDGFPTGGAS
jgi:protein gp37